MNDTHLDRLRAMRDGLDREIEAPDARLLSDLRRSFTAEQLASDHLDAPFESAPTEHDGRASRRQLLLAGLGGAAACGLVIGGVRFYQSAGPAAPSAPSVPAVPGTPAPEPVPTGIPAPTPAPAGYPPGAALPTTRNPLPDPIAPTAASASPRKQQPVRGVSAPALGEQDAGTRRYLVFEESGDEKGSAPDPRAIRRWQDSGVLQHTGGGGVEATLRRTEATSYRFFDYGSEQAFKGVPYAGNQEHGERTVLWQVATGVTPDPERLLTDTVQGLPPEKQRLGVVGYWTIRSVAERLVIEGQTMLPAVRAAYIKALQQVEGVEVTGANSNPAGGPVDVVRIAWMNAIGTASVEVRFIASAGLIVQYLDERYLDNRVCMPRETGQCTPRYLLTLRYEPV